MTMRIATDFMDGKSDKVISKFMWINKKKFKGQ
jgi:hypothetical protein